MKIAKELLGIDRRLVERLKKENLSPEERNALIEARADLVKAPSRMLTAKIVQDLML